MDIETTLVLLIGILSFVTIVALRSLSLKPSSLSPYEKERRIKLGDEKVINSAKYDLVLPDIIAMRYVLEALLTVLIILSFVGALGWFIGVLLSMGALLVVNPCARQSYVGQQTQKIYDHYKFSIMKVATKLHPGLKIIHQVGDGGQADFQLHSKEELLHIITEAKVILSQEERHLLCAALQFENKYVSEIMTPKSVVESIDQEETLGPIVLDRLHKTGYSRFPVVDKDLDHVVGLLYAHDLMKHARSNKKVIAKKVMEQKVFYINENQTLQSTLAGFLKVKHHLFIVVNKFEETTGIVTIEDVLEALIGHKIMDEFDQHNDLRAVAKHVAAQKKKEAVGTHIS